MKKNKRSIKIVLKLQRNPLLLRIWMHMSPSFIELPPALQPLQILAVMEVVEFLKIKHNEIREIRAKKLRLPHHQGTKLNSLIVIS